MSRPLQWLKDDDDDDDAISELTNCQRSTKLLRTPHQKSGKPENLIIFNNFSRVGLIFVNFVKLIICLREIMLFSISSYNINIIKHMAAVTEVFGVRGLLTDCKQD